MGTCSAVVTYTATATDNCPGATIVCTPASGSTFPVGTTTVTCTASDASPNSPDATCSFTVTVQDTQLPAITCPANIVVTSNTTNGCTFTQVVNHPAPTATDNCGLASVVYAAVGIDVQRRTTTVTCTATDTSGNTAACSFTVTVGCGVRVLLGGRRDGEPVPDGGEPGEPELRSVAVHGGSDEHDVLGESELRELHPGSEAAGVRQRLQHGEPDVLHGRELQGKHRNGDGAKRQRNGPPDAEGPQPARQRLSVGDSPQIHTTQMNTDLIRGSL
ncbi:MAG: HYR domain-containing protein [Blastocatellia bacterium]|nr:HYR domain-containing protein [Blastocatellia bacterium]